MIDPIHDSRPTPGFDFNRPTIVALLYIGGLLSVGIATLIGLVLAYVWQGEAHEGWEESHFRWHIRTFWLGLLFGLIGFLFWLILLGWFVHLLVVIWVAVRTVKALLAAQRREPILNADSWMW